MSDADSAANRSTPIGKDPIREVVLPIALGITLLLTIGACLISPTAVEQLLLGWLYFPLRTFPAVTFNWELGLLGGVTALLFVAGLHRALCWWRKSSVDGDEPGQRPHSWRSTLAIASLLMLGFATGIALVGGTHQLVWITRSWRSESGVAGPAAPPVVGLLSQAKRAAQYSQQRNNLKQIGLGAANFHDADRHLPPGGTVDDRGRLMHGWAIFLGPYIGYSTYGVDYTIPWNEPPNDRLYRCAMYFYLNPSVSQVFDDEGYGLSHVAGNVHVLPITPHAKTPAPWQFSPRREPDPSDEDGRISSHPLAFRDIHDGTSNTFLVGEAAGNFRPWGHPANVRDPALGIGRSASGFGGPPGQRGALMLMCDGSVRFVSHAIEPRVAKALGTPAGGELINESAVSD